jgi:hypothetical protein
MDKNTLSTGLNNMTVPEICDDLVLLLSGYLSVHRKTFDPSIVSKHPDALRLIDSGDHAVLEQSLFSHVGELPIIASFLHQYMDVPVDLGRSLIILSIHDIGETVLGDQLSFTKDNHESNVSESEIARQLLSPQMYEYYREYSDKSTNEGLFAYSVDKLGPALLDLIIGKESTYKRIITLTNWKTEDVITNIRSHNMPKMTWSPFLSELYEYMLSQL